MQDTGNILMMKNISKSFLGVSALNDVNLLIEKGKVHALMGENGAGKSTLMKILMGIYKPDTGEIVFDGQPVEINNPSTALRLGISMIHQELSPIPEMTIAENIFLGRETSIKNTPFLKRKELIKKTANLLYKFNVKLDPRTKMSRLSVAQIQMIEIIKAVSYDSKVIIMDEPTAALSDEEVKELFHIIQDLKRNNVGIIYISHRLEEIFQLADRVTVLRDGQYIGSDDMKNMTKDRLITMMVGRELNNIFPKLEAPIGTCALEVKGLTRKGVFHDISFKVHKGEILGISGLVGSGRSEIVRAIFGVDPIDAGEIAVEGKPVKIKAPRDAIKQGIAMVSEDRKELGLILCRSIKENIALTNLNKFCLGPLVNLKRENTLCGNMAEKLLVKMSGLSQAVQFLSGGNQQKVVLAKWLMTEPGIMILDEPTRGIDVGAKSEIHRRMSELAKEGMAIIMISSELPEIIGMSDRILVIGEGSIKGEFKRGNVTQEDIMKMALGGGEVA